MTPMFAAASPLEHTIGIMDEIQQSCRGGASRSEWPGKLTISVALDNLAIEMTTDDRDMWRMGRTKELKRNFGLFSSTGFSVVLGCSWEFALVSGTYTLANGGIAGTIWMFLAVCICMFAVMLSLAEMASITPSSGAQYHWVSEFAPAKCQKYLSFIVGWFAVFGWQSSMTLVGYAGGQQIQSLIALINPTYHPSAWHASLFTMAVTTLSVFCNIFLAHRLPALAGLMFVVHIAGFFFIVVLLWVMGPRTDASVVFTEFDNQSGWSNVGLATIVGIVSPVITLIGADSTVHLSEESKNASRDIPRAMIWATITNYSLGFIMIVTFMFHIGNVEDIVDNVMSQSYVAVIREATGSTAASAFCTALVVFMLCACGINQTTTSSRTLYAFARDHAMPFSGWISSVRPGWDFPLNAVIATLIYGFTTSLFIIASPTSFGVIMSISLSGLVASYLVAIMAFFLRKLRAEPVPKGSFSMGRRVGLLVNLVAICFLILVFILGMFPQHSHPSPAVMNWSAPVMVCFIAGFSLYYWFFARKRYIAPRERLRKHD